MSQFKGRHKALACSIAAAALLTALSAQAEQSTAIAIPAGPMSSSLTELGRSTGMNILFSPDAVQGLTSPSIDAKLTPEEAARLMVKDTALNVVRDSAGSLVVMASAEGDPRLGAQTEPQKAPVAQSGGIEEVVVTANRREETAQRTALAIQVLSSDDLRRAGVMKPEDLSNIATGVMIAHSGQVPQIYVRGVGNYGSNVYHEGAIAMNTDGVYISRGWARRNIFFDVDRVEVLKGPQGTLYGRNATGGALNILTTRPKLGEVSGYVEGEIGNYDLYSGTAAINIPLGAKAAMRASGQIIRHDGYLSDGYDDESSEAARLHVLMKPTDDLSILVTGYAAHMGGRGMGQALNPKPAGTSAWDNGAASAAARAIPPAQPFIGSTLMVGQPNGYNNNSVYAISAEIAWDFGPATLTVIPAYRVGVHRDLLYVATFQQREAENDSQTSVEARLSGQSERLKWVAGGFVFTERQSNPDGDALVFLNSGRSINLSSPLEADTTSYAAFGQATLSVTKRLRLTGGLRYTYENKSQDGIAYSISRGPACAAPAVSVSPPFPGFFCQATIPLGGSAAVSNLTWKAGVEVDVGPQSMLYASASTGFKSGGFFAAPPPNSFRPEKLAAYELGIKNRLFDNTLQLNAEAFYWSYFNHQESFVGPTIIPNYFTTITRNSGQAYSYGGDIDIVYQPSPRDRLSLKVQYNKTNYTSFSYTNPSFIFGVPVIGCVVTGPSSGTQTINCAGRPLLRAPVWSGNVGYDHTFELDNGASLTAGTRAQFSSSYYLTPDFLDSMRQHSYVTFDADLTYRAPDDQFEVTAWIRNITEQSVMGNAFRSPYIGATNPLSTTKEGFILASLNAPRTFGLRARYKF